MFIKYFNIGEMLLTGLSTGLFTTVVGVFSFTHPKAAVITNDISISLYMIKKLF